ncbi:MAG: glucose/galactose MFS transporter, partial [Pseudohongiellaceae bacterium]
FGCLLFLPAASLRWYGLFLLAYFILASGMTLLQVAANPFVTVLGEPATAASRLNLSQAFNSLGTTVAPALGAIFILSDSVLSSDELARLDESSKSAYFSVEASAVQGPFLFLALALFMLAAVILKSELPKLLKESPDSQYGQVLKERKLVLGAIGIFFYVGAEVTIGSYLINYFLDMNLAELIRENRIMQAIVGQIQPTELALVDDNGVVGAFVMFYWGGAMVGRFFGYYLMRVFSPNKILCWAALVAIFMILISIASEGFLSLWSILGVGLFNSVMFPTIFSIALEDLEELKAQGSGILCTAIVGGAFIPPLYGFLTDQVGFKIAFILLLVCYLYIWLYGRQSQKNATV